MGENSEPWSWQYVLLPTAKRYWNPTTRCDACRKIGGSERDTAYIRGDHPVPEPRLGLADGRIGRLTRLSARIFYDTATRHGPPDSHLRESIRYFANWIAAASASAASCVAKIPSQ